MAAPKLVRLTSPNGAEVTVTEQKAERLIGYTPVEDEKPTPRRAPAKKSTEK